MNADGDQTLQVQLASLPALPGTYLFRDEAGGVLYVGKAKNLSKRVRSYFNRKPDSRIALMVTLIRSVETIIAGSEKEALLLENTLIKRYRPPFNVDLKDDKSYPFFRVTIREEYPRIELTRKIKDDGSLYFGPYTDAGSARRTLSWLEKNFPLRRCGGAHPGGRTRPGRPCLDHQMGNCLGPCGGEVPVGEYRAMVDEIVAFLKGDGRRVASRLKKQMEDLSGRREYEEAARIRDRIRAMESVMERQDVVGNRGEDLDVLGFAAADDLSVLTCLFIRSGLLMGRKDLVLEGGVGPDEAVDAFMARHYMKTVSYPGAVLCPVDLDFAQSHQEIISEAAGRLVTVQHPKRGRKVRLMELAGENAAQALSEAGNRAREAMVLTAELKSALKMSNTPTRIECVDVSHTAGKRTYGSLAVWEKGRPRKEDYRLFKISSAVAEGDDYAAMRELVTRRYKGSLADELPTPDLLLVDGGKGHLRAVVGALGDAGADIPAVAAIAKGKGTGDSIYLPDRANPVAMKRTSRAFLLLQAVRDEAHRFAVSSHRKGRSRNDLMSVLDTIDGIGPVRRRTLLGSFRSVDEIRSAGVEELAALKGFNRRLAHRVKESLQ